MLRDNARYEKVEAVEIKKVEGGASPTRRSAKEKRAGREGKRGKRKKRMRRRRGY